MSDTPVCAACGQPVSLASAARCGTCRYALELLTEQPPWWQRPELLVAALLALLVVLAALASAH